MLVQYTTFGFLLQHFVCTQGIEEPTVETSLGLIRGHHKLSYKGRIFSAFEGIPYAKPPIGDLRFEEPHRIEPWSGIWNATTQHDCIQLKWPLNDQVVLGSEDCLYLNVYVPKEKLAPNESLDVLVHIHGGAFKIGSSRTAGPEYLMDRDIISVSLNYRLDALGFLSTEDDVVPGNNGMKDQVLALEWIQDHIKLFGGNPKSITITGLSAGGASAHLHYFSPLTKGLFHRGISQSGTALAPWVIQEAALGRARKSAGFVGCSDPSTKRLIECLKQRPAKQLIRISIKLSPFNGFPISPFAPVIEKKSKRAFLTDYPYKLLEHGHVADIPWITSVTTEEGIVGIFDILNKLDEINKHWNKVLSLYLDYNHTVANSDKRKIAEDIKKFYFGEDKISHNNIHTLIKLIGDRYFNLDCEKSARMHAKMTKSSIYSYIFGYKGNHNHNNQLFNVSDDYGVGHGMDSTFLYQGIFQDITFKVEKFSESDERIKELFLDMVTSFARNGKPTVKGVDWKPVSEFGDFHYLFIHNDGVKMASKAEIAPTKFWSSLPIRENEIIVKVKDEL